MSSDADVTISHPEKVLFPADGITKGEMADYYRMIAPFMVPHVARRPLTMERFHRGIGEPGFFQKSVVKGFPKWLERVAVPKKDGTVQHPLVTDAAGLLWLANQNCITPHVWTVARARPDASRPADLRSRPVGGRRRRAARRDAARARCAGRARHARAG